MNPLGVHFLPVHTGQHHYQFIRDMQPGILKLVGGSTPDVQQIADGYAAAPNALIYLRNVARSEQHDFLWHDPIRAAQQHVQEWHADIQERAQQARERHLSFPAIDQLRILGVNEPVIELFPRNEDMSNYAEWRAMMNDRALKLDEYMITFGFEANRLGYGAGLGNISSGQPANKKPGEYPTFDWFPKTRKLLESTRGKNSYICHEYWRAETGPEGHADWHAWRFMHLNVDCDIDVLESGVDQKITSEDPHGNRGWHGHMDAAAYVDQHRRYINRARQDSRFRCETPFTLDGDKMWESFWIEGCMPEMVALSSELRATSPIPSQLPTPPVKPVEPTFAWVNAPSGANIRSDPETGKVLIAVPYGEQVAIIGHDKGSDWYLVRYGDIAGWMMPMLLSRQPVKVQPEQPQPEPMPTGIIEPRVVQAILKIESGGRTHGANGKPIIRFEAHIFRGKAQDKARVDQFFRYNADKPWTGQEYRVALDQPWKPIHTGNQQDEYDAFAAAQMMDIEAAHRSISMGAAQIMGFNHARIGYPSAEVMFRAFQDASMQIIGFINFFLSDSALTDAMRRKDWREIAKRYNGADAIDTYAPLLEKAYQELGGS